ncbi:hypothetical protein CUJ91_15440 [Paraburkholderia graminis]|nr:hypothetical protein CUJ91_15440 [Paraburkholderia graminis]
MALPLCGAALTFFAAAKKVSKESGLTPVAYKWVPLARFGLFLDFAVVYFALPLCGAALTFFAAAKKVSKESGLTPPACRWRPPGRSG